jgi:hypothetical protein
MHVIWWRVVPRLRYGVDGCRSVTIVQQRPCFSQRQDDYEIWMLAEPVVTLVQIIKCESSHYFAFDACMPILTRLKQKMRDSPYAIEMPLSFVPMSCDTCETPAGCHQPGAAGVALFALNQCPPRPGAWKSAPSNSVDFVGKLVRYVHCMRGALSFPDWCGNLADLNVGTIESPIGASKWPNGQLLRALGSGSSIA